MSYSAKTQHAIRRSTRLPLEIPVLVTSQNPDFPFSATGNTTLVNAHGCGVVVPCNVPQGADISLELVAAKRQTTARVVVIVSLGGDPETWLIGLEFDAPGNFWGIDYAPSDWKIEEEPLPVATQPQGNIESSPVAQSLPPRRWRLTDISPGACYLETTAPFDVATALLMSIRASKKEWLLSGVVRVSHSRVGMGVEFVESPLHDRRVQVEDLIETLSNNREVPRIFVGRKEREHAASIPGPEATANDGSPDPLLQLVRDGTSLTVEQFLSDLRAQRLAATGTQG